MVTFEKHCINHDILYIKACYFNEVASQQMCDLEQVNSLPLGNFPVCKMEMIRVPPSYGGCEN